MGKEYIDRGEMLFRLETGFFPQDVEYTEAVGIARYIMQTTPPAEVEEVKYARWHTLADYKYRKIVECTNCKTDFEFSKKMYTHIDLFPRCPRCGAHMEGIDERVKEICDEVFGKKEGE